VAEKLRESGVALFALSYDSVDVLRIFTEKHGITFPLLSDGGSHVIRQLGLHNERVAEDHAVYGIAANPRHVGLPYPGVFVLDQDGTIVQKRFHESYRVRDTGAGVIAQTLDLLESSDGAGAVDEGGAVSVRGWLDSPTYVWFQRLHLNVEVVMAPGVHIYDQPVPRGFVPLSIGVEPIDGLEVGTVSWPSPRLFRMDGLDETFWVHEGTARGALPLTFMGAPGAGDHVIRVTVAYQACSASVCLVPSSLRLELPVKEMALVGRELPRPTSTT